MTCKIDLLKLSKFMIMKKKIGRLDNRQTKRDHFAVIPLNFEVPSGFEPL